VPDALIEAIRSGKMRAVREAVAADPKAARHARAVVAAGRQAFQAALAFPLSHGADPELTGAWPPPRALIVAAFLGQPADVERLRRGEARMDGFVVAALGDLDLLRQTLLGLTARLETVVLLLDGGTDLPARTRSWNDDGNAPYLPGGAKNAPLFKLFLERGAGPAVAFFHPIWSGPCERAEMALEHIADPDRASADRQPLLNNLIWWGQIPQTLCLLARRSGPNIADDHGWIAVHQAPSRGNLCHLKAVLEAGGNRGRRDREGATPLVIAAQAGPGKLAARPAV